MTKIEWCDETWNPITGCTPISEGCQNCYAKRMANRLRGRFGYPEDEPFKVTMHGDRLHIPGDWKKPKKIFVCSMGDIFHEDVKWNWQFSILQIAASLKHHRFLFLTKRPQRALHFLGGDGGFHLQRQNLGDWPFKNLWLGVTTETQDRYDERWSILGNNIPAAVKFVSIEPALEYVNIDIFAPWPDWVIWGPETGPGKRPYKDEWAEATYEQCREKNIPFFDKRKDYLAREFPK